MQGRIIDDAPNPRNLLGSDGPSRSRRVSVIGMPSRTWNPIGSSSSGHLTILHWHRALMAEDGIARKIDWFLSDSSHELLPKAHQH